MYMPHVHLMSCSCPCTCCLRLALTPTLTASLTRTLTLTLTLTGVDDEHRGGMRGDAVDLVVGAEHAAIPLEAARAR